MNRCAVVIPAFNEQDAIQSVASELSAIASVIVVDDASTDRTADQAASAGAIVVRLTSNMGYGAAVDAGFREAMNRGCRFVVTADGDGQHDAAEVERFVRELAEGEADLLVGIRPRITQPLEKLCAWYARRTFGVCDPLCGLKGYDVRFYEEYGGFDKLDSVGTELMTFALRHGARWRQHPITLHTRSHGGSRFYVSPRSNLRIARSLWALMRVR